jgi:hypothetical protein
LSFVLRDLIFKAKERPPESHESVFYVSDLCFAEPQVKLLISSAASIFSLLSASRQRHFGPASWFFICAIFAAESFSCRGFGKQSPDPAHLAFDPQLRHPVSSWISLLVGRASRQCSLVLVLFGFCHCSSLLL